MARMNVEDVIALVKRLTVDGTVDLDILSRGATRVIIEGEIMEYFKNKGYELDSIPSDLGPIMANDLERSSQQVCYYLDLLARGGVITYSTGYKTKYPKLIAILKYLWESSEKTVDCFDLMKATGINVTAIFNMISADRNDTSYMNLITSVKAGYDERGRHHYNIMLTGKGKKKCMELFG
jgi:hypothetical protein